MEELRRSFTVAEVSDHLVLTAKEGNLKLFFWELDDVVSKTDILETFYGSGPFSKRSGSEKRNQSHAKHEPSLDRSSLERRIAELELQVERLRTAGKTVMEQREDWKRRALEAETKNSGRPYPDLGDQTVGAQQYSALKRQLAKMFHPDNGTGSAIETMIREAMFKEIWAEVEKLERQGK